MAMNPPRVLVRDRLIGQYKPVTGPIAGGTAVTICATGLTGATGVQFGSTPGTAFVVVDDNTATVTAPAHAAGAVAVTVQHPLGNFAAPATYLYV